MNASPVTLDPVAMGRTLDDLAAIGNRFAGSPGESACRDYLLAAFASLGLSEVRLEPFDYLAFDPGPATCSVMGSSPRQLRCNPLQYTAAAETGGEAIYLGEATAADFERVDRQGVDLRGRVVLVHTVFPFDLSAQLQERGIAGLVHICETPDEIVGTFAGALYPPPLSPPWPERPTSYCGVTVGHAEGRALISTLTCGAPVEIRIGHQGSYRERSTGNVVGVIPGSRDGEVILSAHYDSQAEGSGIFDNGGGLASLLETARRLLESKPRRRIVFLASAAEEVGVWGATAYAHAHAAELRDAVAMVNLDGIASAYPSHREIWSADPGLIGLAAQTAEGLGWKPDRIMNQRSTFGDHAPFGDAGVPSCLIWRPDFPYYHSSGDRRERVDEAAVAQTASVSATLADRLAQGADVPVSARATEAAQ